MDENRRLAILVQFDPEGGLPVHVRIHLEHHRPLVKRLVLVSNSPLTDEARARADKICDRVVVRNNVGWDFAAWRDALTEENPGDWNWTILTNSSVIGPLFPLAPILARMEIRGADFWGMTRSREIRPHLQSWFAAYSQRVTTSEPWRDFWSGVRDFTKKYHVIREYELRLTASLEADGLRSDQVAAFATWRLEPTPRFPFVVWRDNETLLAPLNLVERGVPYLKASLIWGRDRFRRAPIERIRRATPHYPWAELKVRTTADHSPDSIG